MHFFYLDESGDTGADLDNKEQPVFVLAGLSVADKKWNNTKEKIDSIIKLYFDGEIPPKFEVHSNELLSPKGEGPFEGHPIEKRLGLVRDLLNVLDDLGHQVHYFATEKSRLKLNECIYPTVYDSEHPYLLSFDYLITYMNWHVKRNLGQSARGMIVMDEKVEHHESVESIIHNRRYEVPNTQKVKWIVEFSYPIDSRKNPMIQLSDLVALCIKRFLEIDKGYKPKCPEPVKEFYAECFSLIDSRVKCKKIIERNGKNSAQMNSYLSAVQCKPSNQWRKKFGVKRN